MMMAFLRVRIHGYPGAKVDGPEIVAVGAMHRRTGGQAAVDSIPGPESAVPVSPSARFD